MVWTPSNYINLGVGITAAVIGIWSLLRTRVKGSKFIFAGVYVEEIFQQKNGRIVKQNGDDCRCRIRLTVTNTGDRMGMLKINKPILIFKGKKYENERRWDYRHQPGIQIDKVFVFKLPINSLEGWTYTSFIINGIHHNHKGGIYPFRLEFKGSSDIGEFWTLQLKLWQRIKKVFYRKQYFKK